MNNKVNEEIEKIIFQRNNSPLDDFLGLSPTEMHYLLYEAFSDQSPVQIRSNINDTTLDQIPLFRIVEEYLKIIQRDRQIKLTPLGALPKKVFVEVYDKKFLIDKHIESGIVKLWKEHDCISIMNARFSAELGGLVKKTNGKLSLTKKGSKLLLPENRLQLFKSFFQAFTERFAWSYNDGYTEQPVGQLGWAFSIILLIKFGDQPRLAGFYAEKYLKAFPDFITVFKSDNSTPERQFTHCYSIRTFDRFALWFGFVKIEKQKVFLNLDTDKITKTDLVKLLFNSKY
jgi:hypothetical protein